MAEVRRREREVRDPERIEPGPLDRRIPKVARLVEQARTAIARAGLASEPQLDAILAEKRLAIVLGGAAGSGYVFLGALERLEQMPTAAAEHSVIRTYLEWMVELPWKEESEDRLSVEEARRILDEDHWGLEKVKDPANHSDLDGGACAEAGSDSSSSAGEDGRGGACSES